MKEFRAPTGPEASEAASAVAEAAGTGDVEAAPGVEVAEGAAGDLGLRFPT